MCDHLNAADASAGGDASPSRLDPKKLATLTAEFALKGVTLHVIEDDRGAPLFVASRWSLTRQMNSVAEVEDFLRRIGGAV